MHGSYQNLTLVSSRFSRKTGRSGGTCPCRKWNHCHTAVASGDRNQAKKGSTFAPHLLRKTNTRPPQGGRSAAPKMGPRVGPPWNFSGKSRTGLRLHRRCLAACSAWPAWPAWPARSACLACLVCLADWLSGLPGFLACLACLAAWPDWPAWPACPACPAWLPG